MDDLNAAGTSGPAEAINSRPLAMYGVARRTKHANQITVDVTSMHAKASLIGKVLSNVSSFLKRISSSAEQWTQAVRWRFILSTAFRAFLRGKILGSITFWNASWQRGVNGCHGSEILGW
jgi:hypothetical protein